MKILLLGGTGAMGEHLAHILALKGWDITVTSRKIHKSEPNIMYIQGNAHELDFVESLFSLCFDVIVDFFIIQRSLSYAISRCLMLANNIFI